MKPFTRQILVSLFVLILGAEADSQEIRMGISRANITPGDPVLMSGYEARKTPSTGVHDSLYATAVCFADGNSRILMVTGDVIGFSHEQADRLSKNIAQATGIPADHILLTATHNHGAPSIGTYGIPSNESNQEYIRKLESTLVGLSRQATGHLQPVKIGVGTASCQMNINRRARFADGSVWLGRNPDGPCDHEVGVMKIESIQGDLLAVFVNWACHGTASGQENYQITGDWPGLAARYLEKELGQETVILVTAGASGDINPIYGPNDNFREIQAVGYNLAQEVVKILPAISTSKVENLNIARKTLVLPGKKRLDSRFPPEKLEKGEDVEVRLTAAKIGHVVLTGISGEVMTEIGFQVKKGTRSEELFVVTHCNGSSGYICTDKAFPEGGYEIMVTRLMPGAEEAIVENLLDMVEGLN